MRLRVLWCGAPWSWVGWRDRSPSRRSWPRKRRSECCHSARVFRLTRRTHAPADLSSLQVSTRSQLTSGWARLSFVCVRVYDYLWKLLSHSHKRLTRNIHTHIHIRISAHVCITLISRGMWSWSGSGSVTGTSAYGSRAWSRKRTPPSRARQSSRRRTWTCTCSWAAPRAPSTWSGSASGPRSPRTPTPRGSSRNPRSSPRSRNPPDCAQQHTHTSMWLRAAVAT